MLLLRLLFRWLQSQMLKQLPKWLLRQLLRLAFDYCHFFSLLIVLEAERLFSLVFIKKIWQTIPLANKIQTVKYQSCDISLFGFVSIVTHSHILLLSRMQVPAKQLLSSKQLNVSKFIRKIKSLVRIKQIKLHFIILNGIHLNK